jgi:predicted Zn-dependent protease
MLNGTRAVSINGQSGRGQLSSGAYSGDMGQYIGAVFAGLTERGQPPIQPSTVERTTVNGIPAAFAISRVNNGNGQVDVVVYAYEFSPTQAFHFLTISQAGNAGAFEPMYRSMRRISAVEAAAVKPRKLAVVTVKKGDTVQSLASRMAYTDAQLDRFLVLNALTSNATIATGQKVKIVTY